MEMETVISIIPIVAIIGMSVWVTYELTMLIKEGLNKNKNE